jgi:putative transcriptional regulator
VGVSDDPGAFDRFTGRLVVATPSLGDPNFDRTVVLILEHGDDGAVGVVLNRASDVDLAVPLPDWAVLANDPRKIFVGGPVAQGAVLGLARASSDDPSDGWSPLIGRLGTVDLSVAPADLEVGVEELRVFTGYSGWGRGQLENEIEGGAWFVIDAEGGDAFTTEPERLWTLVMNRQQSTEELLSGTPRHPWLN